MADQLLIKFFLCLSFQIYLLESFKKKTSRPKSFSVLVTCHKFLIPFGTLSPFSLASYSYFFQLFSVLDFFRLPKSSSLAQRYPISFFDLFELWYFPSALPSFLVLFVHDLTRNFPTCTHASFYANGFATWSSSYSPF